MVSRFSKVALTVLTCAGLVLPPTFAEAGASTGTWRNGMVAGPDGVGWYGRHGAYVPARHYGGYGGWGRGYHRPHYGYGPAYDGGYGYDPGYVYEDRGSDAGAAVAGLIGGMALGAMVTGATRASHRCHIVTRSVRNHSGHVHLRRVRVC